jgi:hypothetical protein
MEKSKNVNTKDHWSVILVRILFGMIFTLAAFEAYMPELPFQITPEGASAILGERGSYLYNTVKLVELAVGVGLLFNLFVPLLLIIAAPVVFNIMLYTIFENLYNLPMAVTLVVFEMLLFFHYRKLFSVFLRPQMYSNPLRDETSEIVILEEIEEKMPDKANDIRIIINELNQINS